MPVIKIKELPLKPQGEIQETDLMVIEDDQDTKRITLLSLLAYFGNDAKLEAMTKDYNRKFEAVYEKIDDTWRNIVENENSLKSVVLNLYNDHELTKRRLGKLQENLTDAENDIKNIITRLKDAEDFIDNLKDFTEDYEQRISTNEKNIETLTLKVDTLETDNAQHKKDISQLQNDLTMLSDHIDTEVTRLDKEIQSIRTDFKKYADGIEDKLLQYIDFYHHIHSNPPNFDEPYKGDPMVANYIHPVGTIFESSDPNFDINKYFPGTWKYIGVGAAYTEDRVRYDIYTWIRVE